MDTSPFPVGRQAELRLASIVESKTKKVQLRKIAFHVRRPFIDPNGTIVMAIIFAIKIVIRQN